MLSTNLFLRNPSLQVALAGRELGRELGVEIVLLGEELSYLCPPDLRTGVFGVS